MYINLLILTAGLVLMIYGADFFVKGASSLAKKFHIPQIIIGLTIVAMGTSAPEAGISITSALKGSAGVAIGNVLGSNIINILLILGLTSTICALKLQKSSVKYEIPFLIFITLILSGMGYFYSSLNKYCGLILLALFLVFLTYLFNMAKNSPIEEEPIKIYNQATTAIFIIAGIAGLICGSNLTVNSAIEIAHILNISDRIIGLTVVAIGTSLPELVTCIVAALKKQPDIAVGNIVGSNIFNILFVLGTTCVIQPVKFNGEFFFDGIIAITSAILLYLCTFNDRALTRWEGIIMLAIYAAYLTSLIIK